MVLNVHKNHKAYLGRGEEVGEGVGENEWLTAGSHCVRLQDFGMKTLQLCSGLPPSALLLLLLLLLMMICFV